MKQLEILIKTAKKFMTVGSTLFVLSSCDIDVPLAKVEKEAVVEGVRIQYGVPVEGRGPMYYSAGLIGFSNISNQKNIRIELGCGMIILGADYDDDRHLDRVQFVQDSKRLDDCYREVRLE